MGSLRLALASAAAVVATACILLHGDPPTIQRLFVTELPRAYASLLAWLTPPYLYFVLNAIILSIAASSLFGNPPAYPTDVVAPSPPPEMAAHPQELFPLVEHEEELVLARVGDAAGEKDVEVEAELTAEKPPISVRFRHRKNVRATAEDKGLRRVTRPRREETLETTWRAITEGQAPLARHLRKSGTWETRVIPENGATKLAGGMRKSETFSDGSAAMPEQGRVVRVRREASPGQEELKNRVEAFIKKFNEEMRLQRQLSLQQYMNKINQGSP